jgi:hypothetical protein
MAIDLKALEKISKGNPDDKISVRREWLKEVYDILSSRDKEVEIEAKSVFEEIFGPNGMFDKLFGTNLKSKKKRKYLGKDL